MKIIALATIIAWDHSANASIVINRGEEGEMPDHMALMEIEGGRAEPAPGAAEVETAEPEAKPAGARRGRKAKADAEPEAKPADAADADEDGEEPAAPPA